MNLRACFLCLLLCLFASAAFAGVFNVNTTQDSHAVNPTASATNSSGFISLRSAIEAANAQTGGSTINLPAGINPLSLGELSIAPNGHKTNSIIGAGSATTIVSQNDGSNRVFNIDISSLGSTIVTLAGITIQGGQDGVDKLGGAGVLAGSVASTPKDVLTVSNCVVQNNHCLPNTTQEPGGGIQMAGGDLVLVGCTFSNNNSGQSFGGAAFLLSQSVASTLNATNCTFVNNSVTNNSGIGPDGGGALMIETPAGSVHHIAGCTFNSNRVAGISGNTYGGAIQINGGTLNIVNSTLINNSAIGQGGLGGAVYVDSGALTMAFCRLVGNTAAQAGGAVYNRGSNGANTTAINNWWGCNAGPGAIGCDAVASDGGTMSFNPWIILTNTASPPSVALSGTSTLTASVLNNSSGQTLSPAQISVLVGLPLSWGSATHGSLLSAQNAVQANGQATAVFQNDGTCNDGSARATLENASATANISVLCPDLSVSKTNNVNGVIAMGNPWTWTVHVVNGGSGIATFQTGTTLLLDNLPTGPIAYVTPVVGNLSGVGGTLVPAVDGSGNFTVKASGQVTLASGASFDAQISATASATGSFGNPREGGVCAVDPNNQVVEFSKANNTGTNSVLVTCATITGTVSGGGTICGGSTVITVTITNGTPPYTVTLSNGGGTQVGTSPLSFTVSPPTNTTYTVQSGTDANACPISNDGSATINVGSLSTPLISLVPSSVFANSASNQASGPDGFVGYAWTISNGTITSPTNQQAITYLAGGSNLVVIGLTVFDGTGCGGSSAVRVPVVTGFSVHTNLAFTDALGSTTMGMAFDGTNYWSCAGGSASGIRLAQYSSAGALITAYSPGLDFRSIFTKADGTVLGRAYNSTAIYYQVSPGAFANSGVSLSGGTLDPQSSVVLNGAETEYQAMAAGVVSRWSTDGTFLGGVNLSGFGSVPGEATTPQSLRLATFGNVWLTFNGTNVVSAWDSSGNRLAQMTVTRSASGLDSQNSFSFANGKIFIVDNAGGTWRAFDFYSAAASAVVASEVTPSWSSDVTNKISAFGFIPKLDFLRVAEGDRLVTPSQLRAYQSVMVFSDNPFNDNAQLGDALADYVDQGGGLVLQTFVFANGAGYGLQGRLVSGGYLPFTLGGTSTGTNLVLVKDLPAHPLLDGVTSLSGGTNGFENGSIGVASGTTLVAHWNNGLPLIGAKDVSPGHLAGLNFFPPSSNVFSGCWDASTDGGRLMADALLWSGRIPPRILAIPTRQLAALGTTANFAVNAVGAGTLSYQWRLNGTNLSSATSSALNVSAQVGAFGKYSVVVSNLYGATTSLSALLEPQLRFLIPIVTSNSFSLLLANPDGSPVAPTRLPKVHVYSTPNLALPFSNWLLLSNSIVATNGLLRIDGLGTTNSQMQFYRAVETP